MMINTSPTRKQANMETINLDVPDGAVRNSLQINTPQNAATIVAPCPSPSENANPAPSGGDNVEQHPHAPDNPAKNAGKMRPQTALEIITVGHWSSHKRFFHHQRVKHKIAEENSRRKNKYRAIRPEFPG